MRAREHDEFPQFLTIFMAVFFGALLAMFAHDGIIELRLQYEIHKAQQAVKKSLRDSAAAIDRQQMESQRLREEASQRAQANASANAMAIRLQREREQRKADAWVRYFQPSAACKLDSGMAKCANEYIAARKRFEDTYVDR